MAKQINVRVPDLTYNQLTAYSRKHEMSQKQAIVAAIERMTDFQAYEELQQLRAEVHALKAHVEKLQHAKSCE
jgi:cell division protein FtsB